MLPHPFQCCPHPLQAAAKAQEDAEEAAAATKRMAKYAVLRSLYRTAVRLLPTQLFAVKSWLQQSDTECFLTLYQAILTVFAAAPLRWHLSVTAVG